MSIRATRIRGATILAGNMAAIRQGFVTLLKGSIPRSALKSKRKNDIIDLLMLYDVECKLVPTYDNKEIFFLPRVILLESTEDKVRFKDQDFGNEYEVSADLVLSTDLKEVGDEGHLVLKYEEGMDWTLPKSDEVERQMGMKLLQGAMDPWVRLRGQIPRIRKELADETEAEAALFGPRAFTYLLEHMQQFFDEMDDSLALELQKKNPSLGNRLMWLKTQLKNTLKDLKGESYAEDTLGRTAVREGVATLPQHERVPRGVAHQTRSNPLTLPPPEPEHDGHGVEGGNQGDNP